MAPGRFPVPLKSTASAGTAILTIAGSELAFRSMTYEFAPAFVKAVRPALLVLRSRASKPDTDTVFGPFTKPALMGKGLEPTGDVPVKFGKTPASPAP